MQDQVILWLTALPLVLAAFRVITLGPRMSDSTVSGRKGGEASTQNSAVLAGLSFLGILFLGLGAAASASVTIGLVVLAFGGFVFSYYILSGFRDKQWQGFVAAATQEAAIYWLVLGAASFLIHVGASTSGTEAQAAIWAVITVFSLALILGTFSRMARDTN